MQRRIKLSIYLPQDIHTQLKIMAVQNATSIQNLACAQLTSYVSFPPVPVHNVNDDHVDKLDEILKEAIKILGTMKK